MIISCYTYIVNNFMNISELKFIWGASDNKKAYTHCKHALFERASNLSLIGGILWKKIIPKVLKVFLEVL